MRHLLPNISTLLLNDPTLALALALAQSYNGVFRTPYYIQILELDFISRLPCLFLGGLYYIILYYIIFSFLYRLRVEQYTIHMQAKLTDTN
jgi:hypothetical protein